MCVLNYIIFEASKYVYAVESMLRFLKIYSKPSTSYLDEQSVTLIACLFHIFLNEVRIYVCQRIRRYRINYTLNVLLYWFKCAILVYYCKDRYFLCHYSVITF
jgi:hypothetical protein